MWLLSSIIIKSSNWKTPKDKRTHETLKIVDFSESTAPTKGGKKIVIFTGKICKDDIEVHFSFENSEYNPNEWLASLAKYNFLLHIHIMLFNKLPYSRTGLDYPIPYH